MGRCFSRGKLYPQKKGKNRHLKHNGRQILVELNVRWKMVTVKKPHTSRGLSNYCISIEEMRCKHPQSTSPKIPPGVVSNPPKISDQEVLIALKSFPNGSAPGPSGLRPSHLKEAATCPSPDSAYRVVKGLAGAVRFLSRGEAPLVVTPATLLACKKKSGGNRPIAVGEVCVA